ncbi:MAG: aldehyde dehydrogenase family protein [Candidatus Zixiibacteriota bacterium]|nr:MAG: aldehyde dehydrogenase family protein [candidate division Zixibacteria bacterium]
MSKNYKMYLGGKWVDRKSKIKVINPYDNTVVGSVAAASRKDYSKAIEIAYNTFRETRELPCYKREETCRRIADSLENQADKLAAMMARELGKAIKDARGEVTRAIGVFKVAAEEAKRIGGEIVDLDWAAGAEERFGLVRRFPIGVVAGISPFNFPLNLVAHKIAPAIASGNTIVLKPASKTPILALMLAELIDQTDHPKGAVSILPGSAKEAAPLLEDPRVKLITFTGSSEVGWWIKRNCGDKPVVLELGGNAGVAIADDANLDYATTRLLYGTFAVAGQSCISVQRIYVHEKIWDSFLTMFVKKVKTLKVGNPLDPATDVGTMVDSQSVENTLASIKAAVKGGAKVLVGGKGKGLFLEPTVLVDVTRSMDICAREAFAPIAVVFKYKSFKRVVDEINNSIYGLQAGIFTNRMKDIFYAFKNIECGGVVINDVPTYRADHQPYGGTKSSGLGREGVKYSIEDMTELKILSINLKA